MMLNRMEIIEELENTIEYLNAVKRMYIIGFPYSDIIYPFNEKIKAILEAITILKKLEDNE